MLKHRLLIAALAAALLFTIASPAAALLPEDRAGTAFRRHLPPSGASHTAGNFARYAAYAEENVELSHEDVVIHVNLKLDEKNYKNVLTSVHPDSLTVLVTKHYGLPKDYLPENLVDVDEMYAQRGVQLRADCYEAFLVMVRDMEAEGLSLYIKSGYRRNSKRGGANSLWYAWPGHSEHQTGLAFDLRKKNVTYETLSEYDIEDTEEYAWLCENAYRYGFINSFPEERSHITGFHFEPWHWRYIGVDIATDMHERGFATYHEYWAVLLAPSEINLYVPAAD